jgi:hypothetical protein
VPICRTRSVTSSGRSLLAWPRVHQWDRTGSHWSWRQQDYDRE